MHPIRSKVILFVTSFALIAAAQAPVRASGGFSDSLDLLGIARFECRCSQTRESGFDTWLWLFMSEPTIGALDPDGPSYGILQPDDAIVAVDGRLITTRAGGERFSEISAGETVELTVRRGGIELRERIVPESPEEVGETLELERLGGDSTMRLAELSKSLSALARLSPELAELPKFSEYAGLAELSELSALGGLTIDTRPLGWFGIGLSFSGSLLQRSSTDQLPRWSFDAPPKVTSLDPDGPGERAGLRRGDLLTHIDGVPLDTEVGGERFSEIRPGQSANWTVRRRGATLTIPVTAEERPD